jgi:hypothetical protein
MLEITLFLERIAYPLLMDDVKSYNTNKDFTIRICCYTIINYNESIKEENAIHSLHSCQSNEQHQQEITGLTSL